MAGITNIILGVIGGLGLFVYGFHITGKALRDATSFRFKNVIEKITANVFKSTALGFFLTTLMQSSSATTVLLVSFINAGLISLANSIGVIFGANVGTTVTVQIIAFNLEQYILPAIAIGVFLKLFYARRSGLKIAGNTILGFGILFLGLSIMKNAVLPLQNSGVFQEFLMSISGYSVKGILLGILISTVVTAIVQASGATLGVVIALASAGVFNDIRIAIPIILGSKIGTCITAFLASIKSNRDSKRVAMGHFIFNVLGTVLTLIFLDYFVDMIKLSSSDISRQIANAHTAISLITAILCLPFVKQFVKLLEIVIPRKKDEEGTLNLFDLALLETPSIAISSLKQAIIKMGKTSLEMIGISCDGFINNKFDNIKHTYELERDVDRLQRSISQFVMEISKVELSGDQSLALNSYREVTNDFERMADHAENIVDNILYTKREHRGLNSYSVDTIKSIRDNTIKHFTNTFKAFIEDDPALASKILKGKREEKDMYKLYFTEVNQKMMKGKLEPEEGMVLIDTIYNMQRINFHLRRILYSVLRINKEYEELEE